MPDSVCAAAHLDLFSFLRAIPDGRMRRGIRIPPGLVPAAGGGALHGDLRLDDRTDPRWRSGSQSARLRCQDAAGLDQAHGRGGSAFIAQVMLYSAAMGVAIGQVCYAARQNHQRIVLKKLRSCF